MSVHVEVLIYVGVFVVCLPYVQLDVMYAQESVLLHIVHHLHFIWRKGRSQTKILIKALRYTA